jgi:hypothetical protein
MFAAVAVLVAELGNRRGQRLSWCRTLLARPPPGILCRAVPTPFPLPGVGPPRALLRTLLLEVPRSAFLLQRPQLVQAMGVELPRHCQLHSGPCQELPQVPHKQTDPSLPEELLRVVRGDPPVDGKEGGPLPIMLIVETHQLSKRQAPPGCLGPDVFFVEAPVWQLQPRGLRHLAVAST